jgi:hypothetical protein
MRLFLLILLVLATSTASADTIYKWVDSNGVTHYGEAPPGAQPYQKLNANTSKTGAGFGGGEGFLDQAAKERAASQASEASEKAAQAAKAERCAKARERITFLDQHPAHRMLTTGDDGQPSRVTDEQYTEMTSKARNEESAACS